MCAPRTCLPPKKKSARAYALAMCAPRTCLPPPKKSARAYALAMCAPRTCLPQKKKIGSRLRARYVRSAHMFAEKKSDPSNSKKSARASRSLCALHAHVCPPIINHCPRLAPPLFKSWCRHCVYYLVVYTSTYIVGVPDTIHNTCVWGAKKYHP